MAPEKPSLYDVTAKSLREAYLAGGFGLATLTLGAILMLAAFIRESVAHSSGSTSYTMLVVGVGLIAYAAVVGYFKEVLPLTRARATVESNKEMINTIQQAGVELSELVLQLQALAFKHADEVRAVMTSIRPALLNIPVIGPLLANSDAMKGAEALSQTIVESSQKARHVILDLQQALKDSDPKRLKEYLADVQEYMREVEEMLAHS